MMMKMRMLLISVLISGIAGSVGANHQCKNTVAKAEAWFEGILAGVWVCMWLLWFSSRI